MANEKQEKELETGIKADASVDVAVEQKEKNTVSETMQTLSASNLIKDFENEQLLSLIHISEPFALMERHQPMNLFSRVT